MIKIHTKQNRKGNWWCFATLNGYDYSFEGKDILESQMKMKKCLSLLRVVDFQFTGPAYYIHLPNPKPQIFYQRNRIDNLR